VLPRDGFSVDTSPPLPHLARRIRAAAYGIADRILRVEATDAHAAAAADHFLSSFHLERLLDPAHARDASSVVRVHSQLPTPRAPRDWTSFDVAHGRCFSRDGKLLLDVCDSVVAVGSPSREIVEVWFGQRARAQHPTAIVNVWSYALQAALRRALLFDLHAACLVSPQGRGYLFAGTSGSGKSTLTVQLAARGWSYLSDDMVLLRERDERIEARGLRRLFSLSEEAAHACNVSGLCESLGTPVASDPSKRRLEPSSVFPGARAENCFPDRILFPRVTDEAVSRTRELSTSETMARLIKLCPWAGYDDVTARDYLRVLAALARQTRARELEAGRDLLAAPARVEEIIERDS
jgi:hypothetical protein